MHAGRKRLRKVCQEQAHAGGGGLRQGKGKGLVRAGPAGDKEIEVVEALVSRAGRAHATLVQAVADPALLPDSSLILAPELDLCLQMRSGDLLELRPKRPGKDQTTHALRAGTVVVRSCLRAVVAKGDASRHRMASSTAGSRQPTDEGASMATSVASSPRVASTWAHPGNGGGGGGGGGL
jgi:hypothetical protein